VKKFAALVLLTLAAACAFARPKEQVKPQVLDSGTWGIYVNGKRVASEKFRIEQTPTANTVTTETKTEEGPKAEQRSEMQVAPNGQLLHYLWQELSPGKSEAEVEPSTEFLVEHMRPNPPDTPRDIPFLVSTSTLILDDNIFTHREILLWRYLASNLGGTCTTKEDVRTCQAAKSTFGVLVPKQGATDSVSIIYSGRHGVTVQGTPRDLDRFDVSSDASGNWVLWVDENKKLVMISIPDAHIEVVRE
jgi:hypothetical protein